MSATPCIAGPAVWSEYGAGNFEIKEDETLRLPISSQALQIHRPRPAFDAVDHDAHMLRIIGKLRQLGQTVRGCQDIHPLPVDRPARLCFIGCNDPLGQIRRNEAA